MSDKINIVLPDYNSFYMSIDRIFEEKMIKLLKDLPYEKTLSQQLKFSFLFISTLIYKKLYSQFDENLNEDDYPGRLIVTKEIENIDFINETLHYSSKLSTDDKFKVSQPDYILKNKMSSYIKDLRNEKSKIEKFNNKKETNIDHFNMEYLIEVNSFFDEFYNEFDISLLNNINMFLPIFDFDNIEETYKMDNVEYLNKLSEYNKSSNSYFHETSFFNNIILKSLGDIISFYNTERINEDGEGFLTYSMRRLFNSSVILRNKNNEFLDVNEYPIEKIYEFIFNEKFTQEVMNKYSDGLIDEDLEVTEQFKIIDEMFKKNKEYINENFNVYYSFVLPFELFSISSYIIDIKSPDIISHVPFGNDLIQKIHSIKPLEFDTNNNNMILNSVFNDIVFDRDIIFDEYFFENINNNESVFEQINNINHEQLDNEISNHDLLKEFNSIINKKKGES